MNKSPWKSSAIAIAATVALGLYASDASALALGRVTVQSSLGEPFRAEVEIPEINAEEAATLRAAVASGAAFRSAGMELTPTIANLKITLQRRPDGRYYLRLTSDRAVNEPFLDLVLEASWASGRVVRDYTMLFDPPNLRQAPPVVTAQAPVTTRSAPAATPTPRAQAPVATPAEPVERAARTPAARPDAPAVTGRAPSGDGQRVTVRPGETAGRLAAAHKPAAISLDQMLVAMLRANPEAFISGNVNRLRAGAVLDLPTAEQAAATEAGEARQLLVAQSRDFNEFRRRVAEGAPAAAVGAANRQAGGKLQAQVEEKAGPSATPDKLTLSKGAVQGKAAAESIARERAAQDDAARLAELNKNIADLNKLTTGSAAATPAGKQGAPGAAGATAAAAPGVGPAVAAGALPKPVAAGSPAPATPAVAAPAVVAPAAATPAVATPAASTSTPPVPATSVMPAAPVTSPAAAAPEAAASGTPVVAAAAATPGAPNAGTPAGGEAAPAAPVVVEPPKPAMPVAAAAPAPADASLVDEVLQNPWLPAVAGGLLAALLGFGAFRFLRRRRSAQADSSFLESRAEPDSFFGASGGQRIDTAEGGSAVGSSMVYSASQLDAAGDVDPVAEADVYLAYGRDLQAEEILKEALRTTPERVAIHSKLLEIYAKRKEVKAFNKAAEEAFSLTRGQGHEWDHICALGQEIDPQNPLYTASGTVPTAADAASATPTVAKGAMAAAAGSAMHDGAKASSAPAVPAGLDLDLDLDLSPAAVAARPLTPSAIEAIDQSPMVAAARPTASLPSAGAQDGAAAPNVTLPPSIDLPSAGATAASASAPTQAAAATEPGMIEFDLSALSLDLDPPAAFDKGDIDTAPMKLATRQKDEESITAGFDVDSGNDPLATKLALAEEFSAIGDPDGARSLAEEVRNEASGDLKGRAERFLAELS